MKFNRNVFRVGQVARRMLATTSQELDIAMIAKRKEAQVQYSLGIASWNSEDLDAASEHFKASLALMPSSDTFYNLAAVHHNNGKHSEALLCWKMSLQLNERADAHINIANTLALQKDLLNAFKHYEAALKLDADDGETAYNYGVCLDQFGNLEEAIKQYSFAVSCGIVQAEKTLRNARARWSSLQSKS